MSQPHFAPLPGETTRLRARLSWIPIIAPSLVFALGSLFGLAIGVSGASPALGIFIVVVSAIPFLRVLGLLISTSVTITSHRFLGATGVLSKSSVDLLLGKLESIEIHKSLSGRLCGFATICVRGTGSREVRLPYIIDADKIRQACLHNAALLNSRPAFSGESHMISTNGPSKPVFEVCVADARTGAERWIEVRASTLEDARALAIATGEVVGQARLKSIN